MTTEQQQRLGIEEILRRTDLLTTALAAVGLDGQEAYPAGFAGVVTNQSDMAIHLFWVDGAVPATVTRTLQSLLGEVQVQVHSATHDRNALNRRIAEFADAENMGITSLGPRNDGAGVVLTHAPDAGIDAVAAAERLGVPVWVVPGGVSPAANRNYDASPVKGGALLQTEVDGGGGYSICSSGFVVRRDSASGTALRMLTAAHCFDQMINYPAPDFGATGPVRRYDLVGLYPGLAAGGTTMVRAFDMAVMNTTLSFSNYQYRGAPGLDSAYADPIGGPYYGSTPGVAVASNGANSGEHLGYIQGSTTTPWCPADEPGEANTCEVVVAENNGRPMVADGDSGGAMLYQSAASNPLRAAGLIHAYGGDTEPCDTVYGPDTCYTAVHYTSVGALLGELNESHGGGWSVAN
ncbi:hypothetical protein ACOACO_07250 [Nocardioides sp. CPCC 205120]|uniref:hypothetical protein n=1 Tax=Nocardioides sp. CPCC 205120 TaxID=3406462 RepID=UPI003B504AA0